MAESKTRRNYKDTVFVDLFGKCKDAKENFLSLYNAIHGTNLKLETTEIKPVILEQTIYTGQYNDVSMVINNSLIILVEQQSTINENMPLRFLGYISKVYDKLIKPEDRYKRRLIKLPKPEFYVIYNGQENYPPSATLRLSEAFIGDGKKETPGLEDATLEILVKVFNINMKDDNQKLLQCIPLAGYSKLVELVNKGIKEGLEDPIDSAVKACINAGILSDYLKENSTEIRNMTFGEYDYETDIRVQRQEAKEEGIAQGAMGKTIYFVKKAVIAGKLSLEEIAEYCELPLKRVKEIANEILAAEQK